MKNDSITTKGEKNTDLVLCCQSDFLKQMDSSVELAVNSVNKTGCFTIKGFLFIKNCESGSFR